MDDAVLLVLAAAADMAETEGERVSVTVFRERKSVCAMQMNTVACDGGREGREGDLYKEGREGNGER